MLWPLTISLHLVKLLVRMPFCLPIVMSLYMAILWKMLCQALESYLVSQYLTLAVSWKQPFIPGALPTGHLWALPTVVRTVRTQLFKKYLFLFYVHWCFLTACISVKGYRIPWNWSYRQLWAAMWMLGIEPWSSGRAASALSCWAISPARLHLQIQQTWLLSKGLTSYRPFNNPPPQQHKVSEPPTLVAQWMSEQPSVPH